MSDTISFTLLPAEEFYFVTEQGHTYKAVAPYDRSHSRLPFPGPDIDQHLSTVSSGEQLPQFVLKSETDPEVARPIARETFSSPLRVAVPQKPVVGILQPPPEFVQPLDMLATSRQLALAEDSGSKYPAPSSLSIFGTPIPKTASPNPASSFTLAGGLTGSTTARDTVTGGAAAAESRNSGF
jgi:hypothetical protein